MNSLDGLIREITSFPIDRNFVPQEKLDIKERERKSLYPWRGQFSPELVDLFLDIYAQGNTIVLDPFVGSGTTLFEAAGRGLECYGAEINPAAVQLANIAGFSNVDEKIRKEIFELAERLLEKHTGGFLPARLFNVHADEATGTLIEVAVERMLDEVSDNESLHNLLATSVMLAMGDGVRLEAEILHSAYFRNCSIISKLGFSTRACQVFLADARSLPLPESSVDLVITSPPYINVFNYHQNYRRAMELMGWRLLEVAPSEIGSNRKHRSNRFLTVIQYCMDMVQAFAELRRVLKPDGILISVVGRESRVRGIPFYNGRLLALSAVGGPGFRLERWQERRFINRYGKVIYEDVLTLRPGNEAANKRDVGRQVGVLALENALDGTTEEQVRSDIKQAIARSNKIQLSQPLATSLLKMGKMGWLRA